MGHQSMIPLTFRLVSGMTTINKLCIKSSYLRICLWQNTSAIIPPSIYVIGLISIMCQCYMFTLTEYAYVGQCAIHFVCLFYGIVVDDVGKPTE